MKRIMTGTVALAAVAIGAAWFAQSQQATSNPTAPPQSVGPLIARGYTDAPSGTVMITNDANGGSLLKELRIHEGEWIKKDQVIAVMSNYPMAEVGVMMAENNLRRTERTREKVLQGTRLTEIALEEDTLKSAIESDRLTNMLRPRSGQPPEEKDIAISVAEQNLKIQRDSLELSKRRLAIDLQQNELDLIKLRAALDSAIRTREEALVRSPIDGVVTQINSRQGEMASGLGIAKVVDMKLLRVFATLDELHLPRLKVGAPVQITFRGDPTVYAAKVSLEPMAVKREKRSEADLGVANVRQVEVEIQADDGVTFPQLLGREARVTFL
jgi:multidrug resistance efflux pump